MNKKTLCLYLTAAAFLVGGLIACQSGVETRPQEETRQVPSNEGSPTGAPQISNNPTENDLIAIQALWEASPHAHTYVINEQGMNSTCARCHAPKEYLPSMDDMPESCAACKFEVEPPPPTIAESAWGNIPCNVCHRVKKDEVDPTYAWLAIPPIDEYEDLATTTELCIKCHTSVEVIDHNSIEVAGAHAGYTCTECHDAHSTSASCSTAVCHPDALNPSTIVPGHDEDHVAVTCGACHDAAGWSIGQDDQGNWVTFQPGSSTPVISHNIVKAASCQRCHFTNNPWNLSPDVSLSTP